MKKQYIISENQLKYLVEGLLNETPTVDYSFEGYGYDHGKVFFNGAKKLRPLEGELEDDTLKIRLFDKQNKQFVFDIQDVNFAKNKDLTPYVSQDKFIEKYGRKGDLTFNITDNEINKAYQQAVFTALEELYGKTDNWDSKSGRGPSGKGGIVKLYQIGDFVEEMIAELEEKGIEIPEELLGNLEGGDWSIMNYFDTQPKIRAKIIDEYKLKNNLNKILNLKDFKEWIKENKALLFQDESSLKQFVEMNKQSYVAGLKNEIKAYRYVRTLIADKPDYKLSSLNLPGSPKDRSLGIDFSIFENGEEIMKFQAKPFNGYNTEELERGKILYTVKSYNISNLSRLNVDRFIFTSYNTKGVIIFKNKNNNKEYFKIVNDTITFNYPPTSYDPNF